MKCQIQWIGLDGKPTPDQNDAVAIACVHVARWSHPESHTNNRIIGYTNEVRDRFPICADHLPQLRGLIGRGWSIEPLPGGNE